MVWWVCVCGGWLGGCDRFWVVGWYGCFAVYVGVVVLMGVWNGRLGNGRLVGPVVVFLSGVGCVAGVE